MRTTLWLIKRIFTVHKCAIETTISTNVTADAIQAISQNFDIPIPRHLFTRLGRHLVEGILYKSYLWSIWWSIGRIQMIIWGVIFNYICDVQYFVGAEIVPKQTTWVVKTSRNRASVDILKIRINEICKGILVTVYLLDVNPSPWSLDREIYSSWQSWVPRINRHHHIDFCHFPLVVWRYSHPIRGMTLQHFEAHYFK